VALFDKIISNRREIGGGGGQEKFERQGAPPSPEPLSSVLEARHCALRLSQSYAAATVPMLARLHTSPNATSTSTITPAAPGCHRPSPSPPARLSTPCQPPELHPAPLPSLTLLPSACRCPLLYFPPVPVAAPDPGASLSRCCIPELLLHPRRLPKLSLPP
jgi:hypothetical protein